MGSSWAGAGQSQAGAGQDLGKSWIGAGQALGKSRAHELGQSWAISWC